MRTQHTYTFGMKSLVCIAIGVIYLLPAMAQDTSKRKTIDITSSFKPSLRTPEKFGFTASAAVVDSTRPKLSYTIPVQQLAFAFYPAPLKPLAYEPDSLVQANNIYVKAGFGNFSTPLLRAVAGFGAGKPVNGSIGAHYLGSKGGIDYQQFKQYGLKGNVNAQAGAMHQLRAYAGYDGRQTYRYGFEQKDPMPAEDSLKLNYNDVFAGAEFGNSTANEAGINYKAILDAHFFSDNNDAKESSLDFNIPMTKKVNENISIGIGLKGMVSRFDNSTLSFSNNMIMLPLSGSFMLTGDVKLRAGLVPSWNNEEFKLLPDVDLEYAKPESNLVLQAGLRGYLAPTTFRNLSITNPWIMQPQQALTNTRISEFYAGVKSSIGQNMSYRISGGFGKMYHVPLFVNDKQDGRSFEVLLEQELSRVHLSGELIYQQGEKIYWSTTMQVNAYSNLKQNDKAYGLLPFELRSSLQYMLTKDFRLKADLYTFNGAWYQQNDGKNDRTKSAFDLNAGAEFDITSKLRLWLSLNNIINQDYQRWNQYRVLGFQAIGGVIFHL